MHTLYSDSRANVLSNQMPRHGVTSRLSPHLSGSRCHLNNSHFTIPSRCPYMSIKMAANCIFCKIIKGESQSQTLRP